MLQCYFGVEIMKGLERAVGKVTKGLVRKRGSQQDRTIF